MKSNEQFVNVLKQLIEAADSAECDLRNAAIELDELGIESSDEMKRLRTKLSVVTSHVATLLENAEELQSQIERETRVSALRVDFERQLFEARLQEHDDESDFCGAW